MTASKTVPTPFGKYQLVQLLGRGGMAEVWKAKMLGPGGFARTLVIKRILSSLCNSPDFLHMFMNEARLSARLDHPNIVHVTEFGEVDGQYFLAMEYVRGKDVVDIVRAHQPRGPMPYGMAALIARDVARALAYAHSLTDDDGAPMGLIHRDISPSNIMVSYAGAVKLVDFGIAKALAEASTTSAGVVKGKVSYMSPEQNGGGDIDHRSDLFSLGVTLHEMLTGRRLFPDALERSHDDVPEPPSRSNPHVPEALDRICARALARDRDRRFQNGRELAMALEEVVHATKWNAERVATSLAMLFPADSEPASIETVRAVAVPPSPSEVDTARSPAPEREPARLRRRRSRVVAGGVVALSFIVAVGVTRLVRDVRRSPATTAMSGTSAMATMRVETVPAGAQVFVDGDSMPRGSTPVEFQLARSQSPVQLTLLLPDYVPRVIEVTPAHDAQLHVALLPAAPKPAAAVDTPVPTPVVDARAVKPPARAHRQTQRITGAAGSRALTPK